MRSFSCRTRIVSGSGAVEALKEFGAKRVFLVADPFFVKNGTAQRVLQASGAQVSEIFDGVRPDPDVEAAAAGTARLREFAPELVAALGGGSALDCAKAMVYFSQGTFPLAAIPTTSGSGSEVTDFAILTHDGVKHPLVDPRLRPDMAILDSDLLETLPKSLIADAGFDVLSHALESYVAKNAGAFSDMLAREAFAAAFACLPASFAGQTQVRLKIHLASAMAGLSFTHGGLGLCHAISHALGGFYHVPHGRLNAVLLPAVISCNAHGAQRKYAEIARAAGLGGSADQVAVRNLKNGLIRLRKELELPQTLTEAGIGSRELWSRMPEIVSAAMADPCTETNPLPAEDFLIRRILEEASGRG